MSFVRALVVWLTILLLSVSAGAQEQNPGDIEDLLKDLAEVSAAEPEGTAPAGTGMMGDEAADPAQAEPFPAEMEMVAPVAADVEEPPPPPKDPAEMMAEAEELADAVVVRMQANEIEGQRRLGQGYENLSAKEFEKALGDFESTMRLLPERPQNIQSLESARRGHADADYELALQQLDNGDVGGARRSVSRALQYVPDHRAANRLLKRIDRDREQLDYVMPAKRGDFVQQQARINFLLKEGRDFFENAEYDKAEDRFEAVRLIDEYNVEAMRFLKRLEERRYELASLERERVSAGLIQMVRDHWNPPLELYVKPPEDILPTDEVERVTDPETQAVMDQMDRIVIPALEFRDANIIDVVDVLRGESEKADESGLGVNIVLKLTTGPAARPLTAEGLTPTTPDFGFGDEFGTPDMPGGFFPEGGGGDPFFDQPAGVGFDDFGFEDTGAPGAVLPAAEVAVPKVTLSLRRVTLLDALQIITEYANLKFKVERGIVFISPIQLVDDLETRVYAVQPSLLEIVVEREELQQGGGSGRGGGSGGSRGGSGGGSGQFIEMGGPVEMTRANVRTFFQEAGVPFPAGTSIKFNPATSQLIVRNTVENLEIFERLLPHFNKPPPQVEIEARFVEILQSDLESLGLEWILTDDWELASKGTGPPATRERVQFDGDEQGFTKGLRYMSATASGIGPISRQLGLLAPSFSGNVLAFSSILTNPELNVVLHALDQSGGTDLLSAPRITTRSGVAAEIQVVQEIIYPTEFESEAEVFDLGDDQGEVAIVTVTPSNFETREVGVILNVTPTVGPDGYTIDLTLAPEVAELVDWIQYGSGTSNIPQPIFASRNATTSILVWDGQTVVMGGLINEEITRNDDKIPILGDIPLLGYLFRSKGERSVKRNLLIFVTARIVDPAGRPVNNIDAPISVSVAGGQVMLP